MPITISQPSPVVPQVQYIGGYVDQFNKELPTIAGVYERQLAIRAQMEEQRRQQNQVMAMTQMAQQQHANDQAQQLYEFQQGPQLHANAQAQLMKIHQQLQHEDMTYQDQMEYARAKRTVAWLSDKSNAPDLADEHRTDLIIKAATKMDAGRERLQAQQARLTEMKAQQLQSQMQMKDQWQNGTMDGLREAVNSGRYNMTVPDGKGGQRTITMIPGPDGKTYVPQDHEPKDDSTKIAEAAMKNQLNMDKMEQTAEQNDRKHWLQIRAMAQTVAETQQRNNPVEQLGVVNEHMRNVFGTSNMEDYVKARRAERAANREPPLAPAQSQQQQQSPAAAPSGPQLEQQAQPMPPQAGQQPPPPNEAQMKAANDMWQPLVARATLARDDNAAAAARRLAALKAQYGNFENLPPNLKQQAEQDLVLVQKYRKG